MSRFISINMNIENARMTYIFTFILMLMNLDYLSTFINININMKNVRMIYTVKGR